MSQTLQELQEKLRKLQAQEQAEKQMTIQQVKTAAESILQAQFGMYSLCLDPLKTFSDTHVFKGNEVTRIIDALVDATLYWEGAEPR